MAHAQFYTAVNLGTLGGGTTHATAINNSGTIVGYSNPIESGITEAFSFSNGTMTGLGTLGGQDSFALGINDAGTVAGNSDVTGNGTYHAFSYSNGTMTDLGTLGGLLSYAYGINNAGTIVGYSNDSGDPNDPIAFSYSNGTMSRLGTLGGPTSTAQAINTAGTIVGFSTTAGNVGQAFSYSHGTMTSLGTLGGLTSVATGINDPGTIVGYSDDASNTHIDAFSYSNGTMTDLGLLNGLPTYPTAINSAGTIVGYNTHSAFIYQNGTMTDLNELVNLPNDSLVQAVSINDSGQIVAVSEYQAYLLLPKPKVSSARIVNISTRGQVGTGGNLLIPGFVISGSGTETLLIRADGPGLSQFSLSGVLAKPSLSVFDGAGTVIASNTGWITNSNPAQIASVSAQVGAFALTPGNADCALIVSLPAGTYTVQVSGVNNTTGLALAEVYEVSSSGTRLVNISTRAQVGTGANIIIPGFVVAGGGTEQLLVRADGPSLAQFSVTGILAQPSLGLFNSLGTLIASNTGWEDSSNPAQISSTGTSVGAFALTPGSVDCAEVVNLSAGAYTMQVSGVNNSTGIGLAEVYEVP